MHNSLQRKIKTLYLAYFLRKDWNEEKSEVLKNQKMSENVVILVMSTGIAERRGTSYSLGLLTKAWNNQTLILRKEIMDDNKRGKWDFELSI